MEKTSLRREDHTKGPNRSVPDRRASAKFERQEGAWRVLGAIWRPAWLEHRE
jgi:hypothetical protein